ncbi:MAG: methyl-accepting chemotaxis protein [Alphaproteobacteria bacterium]|jgi:methyl-accepting chemotaxis protein|nr:methyl-accepting chemotaxis protein [Alphaproteobacteria bacterium]
MRIGSKLVIGVASVVVLTAVASGFAMDGLLRVSALTTEMYEKPLLSISFARNALTNFVRMDREVTQALVTDDAEVRAEHQESATELESEIRDDLAVVRERVTDAETREVVDETLVLLDQWRAMAEQIFQADPSDQGARAALSEAKQDLLAEVEESLSLVVEFTTEQGFNFRENADEVAERTLRIQVIGVALVLLLGIVIAMMIGRYLGRPLNAISSRMKAVSLGEFEGEIPCRDNRDELGDMARAIDVFRNNALEVERLQQEKADAMAQASDRRRQAREHIAADFEATIRRVAAAMSEAVGSMRQTAGELDEAARGASEQSVSVAAAAAQATDNAQSAAGEAEGLSVSIREVGDRATASANVTGGAVTAAREISGKVSALDQAVEKISNVIDLIDDIARQTNLLALNATIEAARAGEAGKGFAVVAGEVKNLANQTASSTHEIDSMIDLIRSQTAETVTAIRDMNGIIETLDENATAIASSGERQAEATGEISRHVRDAADGTREVGDGMSEVAQAVGRTNEMTSQVLSAADGLMRHSSDLDTQIDQFLEKIRAV